MKLLDYESEPRRPETYSKRLALYENPIVVAFWWINMKKCSNLPLEI